MIDKSSEAEPVGKKDLEAPDESCGQGDALRKESVSQSASGMQTAGAHSENKISTETPTMSDDEFGKITQDIIAALKTVYDPEIPSDIYELGLIYRVDVSDNRDVEIDMTLTAPACPVAEEMPIWVENAVSSVAGIGVVKVNVVFDPPWDMSRMSDEARLALNMF